MSGGKGGGSTTSVQIPQWLEDAARKNMARADELAQIGYVPYYGPDVAALSPMQMAAMQNTNDAAAAFGMGGGDAMAGMPAPQTFAGGVQGYSSQPMFQQSLDALAAARPGQFAAMQAPFINPVTGAEPASPFDAVAAPGGTMNGGPRGGPGGGRGGMGGGGGYGGMYGGSDRSAAETAAMMYSRPSGTGSFGLPNPAAGGLSRGTGTGSLGLPNPSTSRVSGTNLPGIIGGIINSFTRS